MSEIEIVEDIGGAVTITLDEAKQFYDEVLDKNIPKRGLPCQLEGILESVCVPLASVRDDLPFCGSYLKEQICIPVYLVSTVDFARLSNTQCFSLLDFSKCGQIGL